MVQTIEGYFIIPVARNVIVLKRKEKKRKKKKPYMYNKHMWPPTKFAISPRKIVSKQIINTKCNNSMKKKNLKIAQFERKKN